MDALWLCHELQKKGRDWGDGNGINWRKAEAFLSFPDCDYCGIWEFKGAIGGLQSCGKRTLFGCPQRWLCIRFIWLLLQLSVFPCFPLLFTVTTWLPSCPSLLVSIGLRHGFLPFHTVWKVVLRIMGFEKRGSEEASSNSLYFWNAESGIVMCFLCQGRQKMSEQVRVCCWAACQLSPFAVTRHPVWHYSGSLWVVSSPLSFGGAW